MTLVKKFYKLKKSSLNQKEMLHCKKIKQYVHIHVILQRKRIQIH